MKKKSRYLIAITVVLTSCSGTQEIYDDTYEAAKTPEKKVVENDDLGYQDYIKNQESDYQVVVDSTALRNQNGGNNIIYNGDVYYNDDVYYSGNQNGYSSYGNNECYFMCWDYQRYGWCRHMRNNCHSHYGCGYNSWGYGYNSWSINYYYGYNPYWGPGYNPYWGSPYWGNSYWGGYYGWGNPYWNNYYGWGYPGWGYPGWGYGYGYGYGNGWGSGLVGGGEPVSNGNQFYGHRGNVSSGSSNTTAYPHTVKKTDGIVADHPFPSYPSNNGSETNQAIKPKPSVSTVGSNEKPVVSSKPVENGFNNTTSSSNTNRPVNNQVYEKPVTSGSSSGSNALTTSTDNTGSQNTYTNKPATNPFSTGNTPIGKTDRTTYGSNSSSTNTTGGNRPSNSGNNSGNQNNTTTYDYNQNSGSYTKTDKYDRNSNTNRRSGSSGSTTSGTNRTTNNNTTTTGGNRNSGNNNSGSNRTNTYSGNRGGSSGGSGSSGGGSRSGGGGSSSGGGGSRRGG